MQIYDRIREVERRAAVVNLSLAEVARQAGVHLSTIHRWRNGGDPRLRSSESICRRLEAVVAGHEHRILTALAS